MLLFLALNSTCRSYLSLFIHSIAIFPLANAIGCSVSKMADFTTTSLVVRRISSSLIRKFSLQVGHKLIDSVHRMIMKPLILDIPNINHTCVPFFIERFLEQNLTFPDNLADFSQRESFPTLPLESMYCLGLKE